MDTLHEKASEKLFEIINQIAEATNFNDWKKEKELIKFIIQQHINNSYMIDVRYYKEYTNLYHEILIIVNDL